MRKLFSRQRYKQKNRKSDDFSPFLRWRLKMQGEEKQSKKGKNILRLKTKWEFSIKMNIKFPFVTLKLIVHGLPTSYNQKVKINGKSRQGELASSLLVNKSLQSSYRLTNGCFVYKESIRIQLVSDWCLNYKLCHVSSLLFLEIWDLLWCDVMFNIILSLTTRHQLIKAL